MSDETDKETVAGEHAPPASDAATQGVTKPPPQSGDVQTEDWAAIMRRSSGEAKTTSVVEPASTEEKRAEAEQRWYLRYVVAAVVIVTLWTELVFTFLLILWQGRGGQFHLNDWLIGVLVGGVLIQTIWCLQAIAVHLFPEGADKLSTRPKSKVEQ